MGAEAVSHLQHIDRLVRHALRQCPPVVPPADLGGLQQKVDAAAVVLRIAAAPPARGQAGGHHVRPALDAGEKAPVPGVPEAAQARLGAGHRVIVRREQRFPRVAVIPRLVYRLLGAQIGCGIGNSQLAVEAARRSVPGAVQPGAEGLRRHVRKRRAAAQVKAAHQAPGPHAHLAGDGVHVPAVVRRAVGDQPCPRIAMLKIESNDALRQVDEGGVLRPASEPAQGLRQNAAGLQECMAAFPVRMPVVLARFRIHHVAVALCADAAFGCRCVQAPEQIPCDRQRTCLVVLSVLVRQVDRFGRRFIREPHHLPGCGVIVVVVAPEEHSVAGHAPLQEVANVSVSRLSVLRVSGQLGDRVRGGQQGQVPVAVGPARGFDPSVATFLDARRPIVFRGTAGMQIDAAHPHGVVVRSIALRRRVGEEPVQVRTD